MQLQLEKMTTSDDKITVSSSKEISEPQNREQIAALAYKFWQARGYPDGTPDEDWFQAEREIGGSKKIDEQEVGSRDSTERSMSAEEADSPLLRFPVRSEFFKTTPSRSSGCWF
jgi:hypothetical protein